MEVLGFVICTESVAGLGMMHDTKDIYTVLDIKRNVTTESLNPCDCDRIKMLYTNVVLVRKVKIDEVASMPRLGFMIVPAF